MSKVLEIPFDKDGNQLVRDYHWYKDVVYVDNYIFSEKLRYIGSQNAASSIHVTWENKNGEKYTSTYSLLHKAITSQFKSYLEGGFLIIEGNFTFRKQGTSFFMTEIN